MKLLSNAPLGEDLFEGKSQKFIANAIVEELENNASQEHRSDCQKMIGIEGSWGSGKSNLIKIVENEIKKRHPEKFHFFTYDVWGHQEDLQRKAILNELVEFLLKNEILCKKDDETETDKWKEKVKQTTGTITETTQVQLPRVSWGVFFCALILITTPVCEGVANLNYFDNKLFLRLLVASFPLILLFLLYFGWLNKKCRKEKTRCFFPTKKLFKETFAEILCVYEDKKIESTNREFVSETNPSVIDFRNLLKDISDALYDSNKHLVIIFDNMDRLPKEKIESLWSSIHTFFAENNGNTNISCIISFDRSHIRAAFPSNEDASISYGDGYIDKTFDVVYRVAPPVLSDWKNFFKYKWLKAFQSIDNLEEYEYVVQAYDFLSGKQGFIPRSIIKFINEMVLLKKIFPDIPERYKAIFILKKHELMEKFPDKSYLGSLKPLYEYDEACDKYIAALIYQVPPERVLSVIYVTSLKSALDQGDKEEIVRISQASFLKDILDEAINRVNDLGNAIVSLDYLPADSLDEIATKKLWTDLYNKAREKEPIKIDETYRLFGIIKKSQEVLLKHIDENLRIELISNLLAPFFDTNFKWENYSPNTYINLIKKFNEDLPLNKLIPILPILEIEPNAYIEILKTHENFVKSIPFTCSKLESHLTSLNFTQLLDLDCLKHLPNETKNRLNIEPSLNNLFAQNQIYNEPNFLKLLKLFEAFPKCNMNPKVIKWDALGQLFNSTKISDLKGILLAIRLIHSTHPLPGNNPFDTALKAPSNDVKQPMFTYLEAHLSVEQVMVNDHLLSTYGIIQERIKEHIVSGDYEITGNGLFGILPRISRINQILATDLTPLYSKMLEFYESKKEVFQRVFDTQKATIEKVESILPKGTLEFVAQHPSNFSKELIQWLISYFDSLTKDIWLERVANHGLYGVKEALIIKYNWSRNAKDALETYLTDVAKETRPIPNKTEENDIIESLNNGFKEHLFKNIRDEFGSGRAKMNLKLFVFFGDWLIKYGCIQQFTGDILRTIAPSFLLEDDSAVQIIANHFDLIRSRFDKETESQDWLEKAKEIANSRENYPLKDVLK